MDTDKRPKHTPSLPGDGSHLQALFDSPYQFFWLLTTEGTLVEANRISLAFAAVDREGVVWRPFWETPWWGSDASVREQLRQATDLAAEGEPIRYEVEIWGAEGQVLTLDFTLRPYREAGGEITLLIAEGRDLTESRDAQHTLEASERKYVTVLNALDEGIVLQDRDHRIGAINDSARRILAIDPESPQLRGEAPFEWRALAKDEQELPPDRHPTALSLTTGMPQRAVVGVRHGSDIRWIDVTTRPLSNDDEASPYAVLTSFSDVTELRQQREVLQHQAQHDGLTNLPNRKSFFDALQEATNDSGGRYSVMYLDLDGFKDVNDTLGHAAGDQLLIRLARRLERCVRPNDLVARLAGDEFAVLLRRVKSAKNAVRIAERILTQAHAPFSLSDGRAIVSTSIGIAVGNHQDDPERVVHDADFALRHAKTSGKDRYAIFDETLGRDQELQHRTAADLKRALPDGQLEIHYQPLVDAKSNGVVGAEALMRWRHPERGMVPPVDFIGVAEQTGEIVAMEGWLIQAALAQLETWSELMPDFRLSINLSARQLEQPDFPKKFNAMLVESGVVPENVVLEITEAYAMQRPREVSPLLHALAELGVTLAIDDFGTGYSNLGHLQHLPFRIVKIDRSFLQNVPDDKRNFALVRTIIAMAQALELDVVAEGVETKTQSEFLYWEGVNWLQGFHFSKPLPPEDFAVQYLTAPEIKT